MFTAAVLLLGVASTVSAQSVNGHAHTLTRDFPSGPDEARITFVAVTLKDGTVVGHAKVKFLRNDVRLKIDIDCLLVSENFATLSGVITHSNDPSLINNHVFFAVGDEVEDANSNDLITRLFYIPFPVPPNELCELVGIPPRNAFFFPLGSDDVIRVRP